MSMLCLLFVSASPKWQKINTNLICQGEVKDYLYFFTSSSPPLYCLFIFSPFLRLYPRHASAMNNLGTLTRSPDEAERYYRKALEINPQHNRALFNLGNLLK